MLLDAHSKIIKTATEITRTQFYKIPNTGLLLCDSKNHASHREEEILLN